MSLVHRGEGLLKEAEERALQVADTVVLASSYLVLGGSHALGFGLREEILAIVIGFTTALFVVCFSLYLMNSVRKRCNEAHRFCIPDGLLLGVSLFIGAFPFAFAALLICMKLFYGLP